jgi:hypothetical protein
MISIDLYLFLVLRRGFDAQLVEEFCPHVWTALQQVRGDIMAVPPLGLFLSRCERFGDVFQPNDQLAPGSSFVWPSCLGDCVIHDVGERAISCGGLQSKCSVKVRIEVDRRSLRGLGHVDSRVTFCS